MKKIGVSGALLLVAACAVPAFGQGQQENPPRITDVRLYVWTAFGYVEFDPATINVTELDLVKVEVDVNDQDLAGGQGQQQVDIFYSAIAQWAPYFNYFAPVPPPMPGTTGEQFLPATYRPATIPPSPPGTDLATTVTFDILLEIPQFQGANQARLRGLIDYDVRWLMTIAVANVEQPAEGQDPIDRFRFLLYAIENSLLSPPRPPAFADSGADQIVVAGSTVDLDGSRTFDGFNIGFNPLDPNVFGKNVLAYVWEQLTGPQIVDPEYLDPTGRPWLARVKLDVIGRYEYRLLVDNGSGQLPTLDKVVIDVVSELPTNRPPAAIIGVCVDPGVLQPAQGVQAEVGDQVTLYAARWYYRDAFSRDFNVLSESPVCGAAAGQWDDVVATGKRRGIIEIPGGAGCGPNYLFNSTNNRCYRFSSPGTWEQAETEAVAAGGHLATLRNQDEVTWLLARLPAEELYWIGLYQTEGAAEPDGGWAWISGEPVTFTNWAAGAPNNYRVGENRAVLFSPVCGDCTYRWHQTDEVGGEIPPAELQRLFQPVGGAESPIASWQALKTGVYYFRLTVDDGSAKHVANVSIEVVEPGTGQSASPFARAPQNPQQTEPPANPNVENRPTALGFGTCGAGLTPLVLLPLFLWPLRGRLR